MPFLPSFNSNSTASPSLISSINPVTCTKCSVSESSSVMNPNPLDVLKNFTVPFFTILYLIYRHKVKLINSKLPNYYVNILLNVNFKSLKLAD